MTIFGGLLLSVLIWAASAAVFTGLVSWLLAAWFPGNGPRRETARFDKEPPAGGTAAARAEESEEKGPRKAA